MLIKTLTDLLRVQFPNVSIENMEIENLHLGYFPEWDSISHFSFLISIEDHFSVHFSVEQMADLKSLTDIVNALKDLGVNTP